MKLKTLFFVLCLFAGLAASAQQNQDWANLSRYREENAKLAKPSRNEKRVVFMGNSITEGWIRTDPEFFAKNGYINRGISGQTTPQMLLRFRQDVVALRPAVVVILAGTNDIAGNTGPSTLEMIQDNLASMTEIARSNGIQVVLSSVLPVSDYPWAPGMEPAGKIAELNAWMKKYAIRHGAIFLDYYPALADEQKGMKAEYSGDGVHPNAEGYKVMEPLAQKAVKKALARVR